MLMTSSEMDAAIGKAMRNRVTLKANIAAQTLKQQEAKRKIRAAADELEISGPFATIKPWPTYEEYTEREEAIGKLKAELANLEQQLNNMQPGIIDE